MSERDVTELGEGERERLERARVLAASKEAPGDPREDFMRLDDPDDLADAKRYPRHRHIEHKGSALLSGVCVVVLKNEGDDWPTHYWADWGSIGNTLAALDGLSAVTPYIFKTWRGAERCRDRLRRDGLIAEIRWYQSAEEPQALDKHRRHKDGAGMFPGCPRR